MGGFRLKQQSRDQWSKGPASTASKRSRPHGSESADTRASLTSHARDATVRWEVAWVRSGGRPDVKP